MPNILAGQTHPSLPPLPSPNGSRWCEFVAPPSGKGATGKRPIHPLKKKKKKEEQSHAARKIFFDRFAGAAGRPAFKSTSRKAIIGIILVVALVAFRFFNFDTTRFALNSLLGEVAFLGDYLGYDTGYRLLRHRLRRAGAVLHQSVR